MSPKEFEQKMNKLAANRKDFARKLKVSNGLIAGMLVGAHRVSPKTIAKIEALERYTLENWNKGVNKIAPQVTFEHITPKGQLITIELPSGIKIVVKGTLKEIVKQLMKTKGE